MKYLAPSLILLLALTPAYSQQKQPAPNGDQVKSVVAEVIKGKAGRLLLIEIKAAGDIDWDVDERLTGKDMSYLDSTKRVLLIVPPAGGEYIITGASCDKSKPQLFKYRLVIEGAPGPGPVPIPPVDPLTSRLKTAYAVDNAAGKGTPDNLKQLGTLIVEFVPYIDNKLLTSTDQIKTVLATVSDGTLKGNLPQTLKAVNDYLGEAIPEYLKPTPLNDGLRQKFKDAAGEIKKALAAIAPGPEPPVPTPVAGPIRVLVVYETAMKTQELTNVINGAKVRAYMDAKGAKDGNTVAFRALDKDVPPKTDAKWVQDAFARPRQSIPWIVIMGNDGQVGFEGPLPTGIPENTVALLRKYGG